MASISDRVGDLGAYLREQRENARLSVRQLASLAGVSNPYLSQVERGLRRPSADVLQQLAKGLRISAEALYVRAGILDDGPRRTVEAAIEADEGLTPRQKKVLFELCAHFRSENSRADTTSDDTEAASIPTRARSKARTKDGAATSDTKAAGAAARTKAAGTTARTKAAGTTARTKAAGTTARTKAVGAAARTKAAGAAARTKVGGAAARTKASTDPSAGAPTNPHPETGAAPSSR